MKNYYPKADWHAVDRKAGWMDVANLGARILSRLCLKTKCTSSIVYIRSLLNLLQKKMDDFDAENVS
jgi:hypothetical protein